MYARMNQSHGILLLICVMSAIVCFLIVGLNYLNIIS